MEKKRWNLKKIKEFIKHTRQMHPQYPRRETSGAELNATPALVYSFRQNDKSFCTVCQNDKLAILYLIVLLE